MGVQTAADIKLDVARSALQEALEAMSDAHIALNITPVWGAEELNAEFKQEIANAANVLYELKKKLG